MFKVFSASAGSGKTFRLVLEYIKLLLASDSDTYFQHVLAITFTNKATAEMKSRVLRYLKALAHGPLGDTERTLLDKLLKDPDLDMDEEAIQRKCASVLHNILHHYSDFSITTIDKFSHKIIRSFARELRLSQNFEIELDTKLVLSQAVSSLLDKAGKDEQLTDFLVEFAVQKAQMEKGWRLFDLLLSVAEEANKERSLPFLAKLQGASLDQFKTIKQQLWKDVRSVEGRIVKIGQEGLSLLNENGITPDDLWNKTGAIYSYFRHLANPKGDWVKGFSGKNSAKAVESGNYANAKADAAVQSLINDQLGPRFTELWNEGQHIFENEFPNYLLWKELLVHIDAVALMVEIYDLVSSFKEEHGVVMISDFTKIISNIIETEPVPFIYERVGERYVHYLVDEFQDTSILQWQNLLPLLEETLSKGSNTNLVVGDAKQSIYRFRGGEARQFTMLPKVYQSKPVFSSVEAMLERHHEAISLDANFRSSPDIISFNNTFFSRLVEQYPALAEHGFDKVRQEPQKTHSGYVSVQGFSRKEEGWHSQAMVAIHQNVVDARSRGYNYADMAILVERNKTGQEIAKSLIAEGIPVMSSESLVVGQDLMVQWIVSYLDYLQNRNSKHAQVKALNAAMRVVRVDSDVYHRHIGLLEDGDLDKALTGMGINLEVPEEGDLSIYAMCERLAVIVGDGHLPNPYVTAFLDVVLAFQIRNGSDIHRFLEWWEAKCEKISIPVPDGIDAVQIMTIHKSKGLQFPIVFCPIIENPTYTRLGNEKGWISEPLDGMPAGMVGFRGADDKAAHNSMYEEELWETFVDTVNRVYVAFTRAETELHVKLLVTGSDHDKLTRPVSTLVNKILGTWDAWDGEAMQFGSPTQVERGEVEIATIPYVWKHTTDYTKRLVMRSDVVLGAINELDQKTYGNILHDILAIMRTPEDLRVALGKVGARYGLAAHWFERIEGEIKAMIELDVCKPFFEPGADIRPEVPISNGDQNFRPDRLLVTESGLSLLEFKTGGPSNEHRQQVGNYKLLLQEITGQSVEAAIVYTGTRESELV